MAELKKAKPSSTKKAIPRSPKATKTPQPSPAPPPELLVLWDDALHLEQRLERELLEDAVKSAKLALDELQAETKTQPFERRRGLRLREKAERVERAFNRLRALRKGEMLPERHPDD